MSPSAAGSAPAFLLRSLRAGVLRNGFEPAYLVPPVAGRASLPWLLSLRSGRSPASRPRAGRSFQGPPVLRLPGRAAPRSVRSSPRAERRSSRWGRALAPRAPGRPPVRSSRPALRPSSERSVRPYAGRAGPPVRAVLRKPERSPSWSGALVRLRGPAPLCGRPWYPSRPAAGGRLPALDDPGCSVSPFGRAPRVGAFLPPFLLRSVRSVMGGRVERVAKVVDKWLAPGMQDDADDVETHRKRAAALLNVGVG